jgi:SET domain-containing protein
MLQFFFHLCCKKEHCMAPLLMLRAQKCFDVVNSEKAQAVDTLSIT